MTDRELLEQAAVAIGGSYWHDARTFSDYLVVEQDEPVKWNPLADDGDALRLVVKLGIHLQFAMDFAVSYAGSVHAKQFTERDGADPYAAARRAIVRAAAEIGQSTGEQQ